MAQIKLWQPNNHSDWEPRYALLGAFNPDSEREMQLVSGIMRDYYSKSTGDVRALAKLVNKAEYRSRNYCVIADKGKFHLKQLLHLRGDPNRKEMEKETLDRIIAVTEYLLENHVLTFPFLEAEGRGKYAYDGNSYWMASPFIEGHHYQGTATQLRAFAEELGKIHRVMQFFPKEKLIESKYVELPFEPDLIKEIKERNNSSLKNLGRGVDSLADEIISMLEERIPRTLESLKEYSFKPGATIGDLHPHGTIYAEDNLKAVLDFEKASFGYPVDEEMGFCLHRFVRQYIVYNFTEKGEVPSKQDVDNATLFFIDAYAESFIEGVKKFKALPHLIAKTNEHKALRVLQYLYGIVKDTAERPVENLHSELYKFGAHILEAEHFKL